MSRAKNQHQVAQAYLRRFSIPGKEGSVWVYDKKLQKSFPSSIEKVASDKGYYDVPEIDRAVGEPQVVERFHELIVDLVRSAWLRFVRRLGRNQEVLGQSTDLSEFLFGSERATLEGYVPVLRDVQEDRCFYCERDLREGCVVDHFVPWSRYPVDLGHNFVLAHATCNGKKSDRIAAPFEPSCRRGRGGVRVAGHKRAQRLLPRPRPRARVALGVVGPRSEVVQDDGHHGSRVSLIRKRGPTTICETLWSLRKVGRFGLVIT